VTNVFQFNSRPGRGFGVFGTSLIRRCGYDKTVARCAEREKAEAAIFVSFLNEEIRGRGGVEAGEGEKMRKWGVTLMREK
jgi:hypothetical protein